MKETLRAGQTSKVFGISPTTVIPLTENGKKDAQQGMKAIHVIMITRIKYKDGTVFEDERVYQALKQYVDSRQ